AGKDVAAAEALSADRARPAQQWPAVPAELPARKLDGLSLLGRRTGALSALAMPLWERGSSPLPELNQPQVHPQECAWYDGIDAARACGVRVHEARIEQNLEVLRDGRTRDGQAAREFVDILRSSAELFQDMAPVRIGDRHEGVGFDRVRSHCRHLP